MDEKTKGMYSEAKPKATNTESTTIQEGGKWTTVKINGQTASFPSPSYVGQLEQQIRHLTNELDKVSNNMRTAFRMNEENKKTIEALSRRMSAVDHKR